MPFVGEPIIARFAHYIDGDVGVLEFRLVSLSSGMPVYDWDSSGVSQTSASGDGPPWLYTATRGSIGVPPGSYQAQWRRSTTPSTTWSDAESIVLFESGSSSSLTVIETLIRSEIPMSWDALAEDSFIGLTVLRLRIANVKSMLMPAAIAAADESSYSNTLRAYISKKAALDLIPTAIEYWMRRKTTSSNTGTNETISYTDTIGALRELAKRLTANVEMLAGNPDVTTFAQLSSDAPSVSNDGDLVTSDPNDWPIAFGVTSGTVTQT